MTIARFCDRKTQRLPAGWLLAGLFAVAGAASAQTAPPNAQFQQSVRQQQVSDQLQKSQQQAQQRQNVANMAQQPLTQDAAARNRLQQAEQAQQQRDSAQRQDLVDRYRDASLPRPAQQQDAAGASAPKKKHGH